MRGTIVDEQGEPIPFAEARLDPGFGAPRRARTDAAGAYEFLMGVTGHAFVDVDRRGFLPARVTVDASWRTDRIRVALRKGRAVEAVVLSEGEPVMGAEVVFLRRVEPEGREELVHAYSDPEGKVRVVGVPPGASLAWARTAALRCVEAPLEDRMWFRLESRPPVVGRVRDDAGKPVVGLAIAVEPRSVPGVVTDKEGRFRLEGLAPAEYRLVVERSDEFLGLRRTVVPGRRVELTVERVRGPHRLRVDVATARAQLARVELRGAGWRRVRWLAPADRVVVFPGLPPGSVRLVADAPGFQDATRDVVVAGDKPETNYGIELPRAGTVRLRATVAARVFVQTVHGEPAPVVTVKLEKGKLDKGERTIAGFGPGRYRFLSRAPGEAIVVREIDVGEKDPPHDLDLTGGAAASLVVTVTDGAGSPVRGATIEMVTEGGYLYKTGRKTDETGVARLSRLILGRVVLVAWKGDDRVEKALEVTPGASLEAQLELP